MNQQESRATILVPLSITDSMLASGTSVPVVDTSVGEAAWVSTTAYTGNETKINDEGSLYSAIAPSTNVKPSSDITKWRKTGPSNRMAPFDNQVNTKAIANGELVYVIHPGFFTGISLFGIQGEHIDVKLYDSPGGELIDEYSYSGDLYEQALGLFEYLFMPLRALTKWNGKNYPLLENPEIVITITSTEDKPVSIGVIALGFWNSLVGSYDIGGVQYGASTEVKTYSYIKTNDDGTVTIIPRLSASNVSCSIAIDSDQANIASEILKQVSSIPVAFIASGLPRYDYINTFGLVSGSISVDSFRMSTINLKVQGYT